MEEEGDQVVERLNDGKGYLIEIVSNSRDGAVNPYKIYVNMLEGQSGEINAQAIWKQYTVDHPQRYQELANKYSGLSSDQIPKRLVGTMGNDNLTSTKGGALYGYGGDDKFTVTQSSGEYGKQLQSHIWAGEGNDTITMNFVAAKNPYNQKLGLMPTYGNHFSGNGGNDTFIINTDNVNNTVVGRFEDFDYSRDTIIVDRQKIDLKNINAYSNVRIVEYGGTFGVPGADPQQWLLINAKGGGHVFYALEAARTYTSDQINKQYNDGRVDEEHFLIREKIGALEKTFDSMKSVAFVDPQNTIPAGVSTVGKDIIIDKDNNADDISRPIKGVDGEAAKNRGELIAAGVNDDRVDAQGGDDGVWGGSGQDTIYGGDGRDTLHGGTGNDWIFGGNDADTLHGDHGNDRLYGGNGDDLLFGGAGADYFNGGSGTDTVSYADSETAVSVDMTGRYNPSGDTFSSIEKIMGSDFNDSIFGNSASNTLMGGRGNDALYGREGNDVLMGGEGADKLGGGRGTDIASYEDARGAVVVNLQNSSLNRGEAAGDTFSSIEGISGSQANDRLYGNSLSNQIHGNSGGDVIYGINGSNWLFGDDGSDRIYGGIGNDRIYGGNHVDQLHGSNGRDTIFGDQANDYLYGGNDNDLLYGGAQNDYLNGGSGNDRLSGDDGNDRLFGSTGYDTLSGGRGADVFILSRGSGTDRITDFNVNEDHLQFSSNAGLTASNFLAHTAVVNGSCVVSYTGGSVTVLNVNDVHDLSGAILFA